MKFKSFRAIAVSVIAVVVVGSTVLGVRACGAVPHQQFAKSPAVTLPAAQTPTAPTPALAPKQQLAEGELALRKMDLDIVGLLSRPMNGNRIKDAFPASAYKVNIYKDDGFAQANRLKVDLDRDGKDDEKWTIEGAGADLKVKRQVSPNDDGNYSEEYRLVGGAWVRKK